MSEPVEIIIIRAQQDFDVDGGLNPIQIEIKDDNITNLLKKHKNVVYKTTPLRLLFQGVGDKQHRTDFYFGKKFKQSKKVDIF